MRVIEILVIGMSSDQILLEGKWGKQFDVTLVQRIRQILNCKAIAVN